MNPFDGSKVLYHVPTWAQMEKGIIPPPVLVTLDPIHRCNLNCAWCNSNATIEKGGAKYSERQILRLPTTLSKWGVKAVCIAGGGEPMLHPRLHDLINGLIDNGIEVGIVTNGTMLLKEECIDALGRCRWVGVSVDAGNAYGYKERKGKELFDLVIGGMEQLRSAHPDLEITYKYLIYPSNILEIPQAVTVAERIGCTYFHARPAGVTWKDITTSPDLKSYFDPHEVQLGVNLLNAVSKNKWKKVHVVNTPGKFTRQTWAVAHDFERCYAVGMTCAIMANGTVGLCCDRRGDPRVELCKWEDPGDILAAWGSEQHKKILRNIDLSHCPRCTYAPHNKLYAAFVTRDDTCKDFI